MEKVRLSAFQVVSAGARGLGRSGSGLGVSRHMIPSMRGEEKTGGRFAEGKFRSDDTGGFIFDARWGGLSGR